MDLTTYIRSHQTKPKMTTDFDCYPLHAYIALMLYRTNPCHDTLFWKPWELRILCHHGFHHRSLRKTTLPDVMLSIFEKKISKEFIFKGFCCHNPPKPKKKGNKNTRTPSVFLFCWWRPGDLKLTWKRHLPRRAWCTPRQWHPHKSWNEGIVSGWSNQFP